MQGLNFEDRFICDPRIVAILAGVPQKYPLGTLTMDGADWPIQLPLVHRRSLDDACKQLGFIGKRPICGFTKPSVFNAKQAGLSGGL